MLVIIDNSSEETPPMLRSKKDFVWEDFRTIFVPNPKDEAVENVTRSSECDMKLRSCGTRK